MTLMVAKPISLPGFSSKTMKSLERVPARIAAILFGLLSGALATFVHFAFVPVGLIVALVGSFVCSMLIRAYAGSKVDILLFAIAWTLVVYRGGTNASEEILIMANTPGYTLLYLGPVLVFFPLVLPHPKQRKLEVSGLE